MFSQNFNGNFEINYCYWQTDRFLLAGSQRFFEKQKNVLKNSLKLSVKTCMAKIDKLSYMSGRVTNFSLLNESNSKRSLIDFFQFSTTTVSIAGLVLLLFIKNKASSEDTSQISQKISSQLHCFYFANNARKSKRHYIQWRSLHASNFFKNLLSSVGNLLISSKVLTRRKVDKKLNLFFIT